jgi:hypothetical protein
VDVERGELTVRIEPPAGTTEPARAAEEAPAAVSP